VAQISIILIAAGALYMGVRSVFHLKPLRFSHLHGVATGACIRGKPPTFSYNTGMQQGTHGSLATILKILIKMFFY
jgi:hypothetical protein